MGARDDQAFRRSGELSIARNTGGESGKTRKEVRPASRDEKQVGEKKANWKSVGVQECEGRGRGKR
jgi:hypothetical protein